MKFSGGVTTNKSSNQRSKDKVQKSKQILSQFGRFCGPQRQFGFTDGYDTLHKALSGIEEVPYCFSMSSVTPVWIHRWQQKWCTKLKMAQKRCPIVFRSHWSNFRGTRAEEWMIWLRFECFRVTSPILIHRLLWNDTHSFNNMEEVPYVLSLSRSSVKFQDIMGWKVDLDLIWADGCSCQIPPICLVWYETNVTSFK